MQTDTLENNKDQFTEDHDHVIEGKDIVVQFDDKVILDKIDFCLNKNENLAIMGRSGSGKSVLMKCVVGLLKPNQGELHVLKRNIDSLNENELNELRRNVGYLFQGGALYDAMSVKENLEFPLKRLPDRPLKQEIDDRVEEALSNVGLSDAYHKMPAELSGGMKKRVALARTIILKPKIILYDEPTTGLDVITSRSISNLIVETQQKYNISSVIVTHDLLCAKITADRIQILRRGRFLAEGSYDDLEKDENKKVRSFFRQS